MGKEQTYKDQLSELGVYNPAFDGEIRQLCILERELSRTMKAWKATAKDSDTPPSVLDPLYASIQAQRRDILAHRDALGLTPKALSGSAACSRLSTARITPTAWLMPSLPACSTP